MWISPFTTSYDDKHCEEISFNLNNNDVNSLIFDFDSCSIKQFSCLMIGINCTYSLNKIVLLLCNLLHRRVPSQRLMIQVNLLPLLFAFNTLHQFQITSEKSKKYHHSTCFCCIYVSSISMYPFPLRHLYYL